MPHGLGGLYVHDPTADKWGSELRITFAAAEDELRRLDFGADVSIVADPAAPGNSWRINNNAFWWHLLRLGFDIGSSQNVDHIRRHIPARYRAAFDAGLQAGAESLL